MPNAALSEAIKEAYASAPSQQIILHTLELRHPAFVDEAGQPVAIRVVRDIFNDAVLNTTAIWMDNVVDLANRQAWFAARAQQGYPILVAENADGAYRTELVWRRRPFADLKDLELATFRWVSWWNSKRLHQSLGYRTPEAVETEYHQHQAAQAASL